MAANNKLKAKSWTDIQMLITASAIALTLVFWNLFAGMAVPQKASQTVAVTNLPTNQSVKIFLGGKAPITEVVVTNSVQSSQAQPAQSSAPAPVTTTRSS
jgi:hypothetical protein